MSLETKIMEDLKKAMRAKNKNELEALRAIKNGILQLKTEKGGTKEITGEAEMKLLQKLVKQRKESAEIYANKGRPELANAENGQAEVIERYLPEQMSEGDIENEVSKVIEETGASGMKDMGKVMGMATKKLSGKADNKLISQIVKEKLGGA